MNAVAASFTRASFRFRKVPTGLWDMDPFSRLSRMPPSGQSLYMALLVGPCTTIIPGVCTSGKAALAELLQWEVHELEEHISELSREAVAWFDWSRRLLFAPAMLAFGAPESPNVVTYWRKAFSELPECALKAVIDQHVMAYLLTYGHAKQKSREDGKDDQKTRPPTDPLTWVRAWNGDFPEGFDRDFVQGFPETFNDAFRRDAAKASGRLHHGLTKALTESEAVSSSSGQSQLAHAEHSPQVSTEVSERTEQGKRMGAGKGKPKAAVRPSIEVRWTGLCGCDTLINELDDGRKVNHEDGLPHQCARRVAQARFAS